MKKLPVILVLLICVSVPSAAAHPYMVETSPGSTGNAQVGITEVYVVYSESIELGFSSLKVFDSNGDQIDNRDTQHRGSDESLVVSTPPLEDGVYTVASKVLSRVDGHLVPDAFVFAVGNAKLERSGLEDPAKDVVFLHEAGARFPGLVGQTIVLGAAIASLLIWGTQNTRLIRADLGKLKTFYHGRFMSVTGIGLVLVMASNLMVLGVHAWRLEASVLETVQTSFGSTWMLRMAITVVLLGVWFWMNRKKHVTKINQAPMLALSLVLIATTTMMGHGAASEQLSAAALDYVHNLVAAVWIGGIIFFVSTLLPTFSRLDGDKKERMSLVVIPRFSIAFVIAVGIVIITGPTLMWHLESDVGVIVESTYGKLIMAKIAIAGAMVGMGGFSQFMIQKAGEEAIRTKALSVHRKLRRSLAGEAALGVILLGVVALLSNGTLPAGEIQKAEAQEILYDFKTTEFSENARFDVEVVPFYVGENSIAVKVTDPGGGPIYDQGELKVKVSNPEKGIAPVKVALEKINGEDGVVEFRGEAAFGFSGTWHVEIEIQRTENANESVLLPLTVKPRLTDLKIELVEYELPAEAAPLYPLYDGRGSVWISDASAPRLWKFDLDSKEFESFSFEGMTSVVLTKDNEGKIWFNDPPGNQIGFIDPATGEITRIGLPELEPAGINNTSTFIQSDGRGNVWTAIGSKDLILKYDQARSTFQEVRLPGEGSMPFALAVDDEGKIWFTGSQSGRIGYIDPEGNEVTEFAPEIPLKSPESLLFDDDGNVWIGEHTGAGIARFDTVLETFERVAVPNDGALPFGMSLDRYGNVWIAQHAVDSLAVHDPDNDAVLEVPIPTTTSWVQFTTTDGKKDVWFVEQRGNKLGMVKKTELPPPAQAEGPPQLLGLKYTEIASPLIALGVITMSLFYVKAVGDKRRLNELING